MLTDFFRRLFGFRQLAEARRQTRIALAMVCDAQQSVVASREQLAACRLLLGVTMRERDQAEAALALAEAELRRQREWLRDERDAARFWITRTIEPRKVSEN